MKHMSRTGVLGLLLLMSVSLFGQATTGTLVGTVTSGGTALPGATVTISSPSLQGTRTAVTGDNGGYNFPGLPPGMYTVSVDLEGMQRLDKRVAVSLAQTSRADAELRMASVGEALTVTANAPAVVETTEVTTNFDVKTIRELPTGRDIREITCYRGCRQRPDHDFGSHVVRQPVPREWRHHQ
jgi:hypothetical protein